MKATLYQAVRLNERGELYEADIENIQDLLLEARKELKEQEKEISFYGKTRQRRENVDSLVEIISILEFKSEKLVEE